MKNPTARESDEYNAHFGERKGPRHVGSACRIARNTFEAALTTDVRALAALQRMDGCVPMSALAFVASLNARPRRW